MERENEAGHGKKRYRVVGMHCASCAVNIENALKEKGIPATVNYNLGILETTGDLESIRPIVKELGYDVERGGHSHDHGGAKPDEWKAPMIASVLLGIPIIFLMFADLFGLEIPFNPVVQMILAIGIIYFTRNIHIPGITSLIRGKPNMDSLVAMSVLVSFVYSTANIFFGFSETYFFDVAGLVPAFIAIGKFLEEKTKEQTGSAIRALLNLRPKKATLLRDGEQLEVDIDSLKPGDMVLVRAGEMIPSDGVIEEGETWVNESMMTGEPEPVGKEKGDHVIGGTINEGHPIKVRITRASADSVLARIIKTVEDAQMKKTEIQKVADRISSVFVPAVLAIAAATLLFWLPSGFEKAVFFTAAVLAVACPCALGLATPTAIMAGSGIAAKKGILIRNPDVLDKSGRIDYLLIDKTGTLTKGEMVVTGFSSEDILRLSASAELHSEHPIGKAIVMKAREMGLPIPEPRNSRVMKGKGIVAEVDGKEVAVGNRDLMKEMGHPVDGEKIWVLIDRKELGWIEVSDELKENAKEVVDELKSLVKEIVMVTGDSEKKAKAVADELGISYRANVLPEEKMKIVEEYQKSGKVAFVGDGINDSPALSRADVGISFPSTEVATESGDLVLMRDSLELIPEAIKLSRYLMKKIRQNFAWAFVYNVITIPVAAGLFSGFGIVVSPAISAALMSFSSISVVLNSLSMKWLYR